MATFHIDIEKAKTIETVAVTKKQLIGGIVISISLVVLLTIGSILLLKNWRFEDRNGTTLPQQLEASSYVNIHQNQNLDMTEQDCHFSDEILSMAKGVDITNLDLLPSSMKGIEGNPGTKSQLIKLTCKKNLTKLDSHGKLISRIPDQFVPNSFEIMSTFGLSSETEEHTEKRTMDSKLSIGLAVGIDIIKLGMFSSSASYERKRKKMISGESYISEMTVFYMVRSAEFRPSRSRSTPLEGNDDFQLAADNLPLTLEEDPASYFELLRTYGTHYFSIARFGGFVKVNTEVTKRLRQQMSEDEIQAKLSFSYKILLKGSMNFDIFENRTAHQFSGLTSSSKYSHGGDASLAFSGNLEKWIQSVPDSPRLIGGKLLPIYNLIQNKSKAAALVKAMQIYLGRAYIKDLKACIGISQEHGVGDWYFQQTLMESLADISNETLADESRLLALGKQVSRSLRHSSTHNVTVEILRAEKISTRDDSQSEVRCSNVEFTISSADGNANQNFIPHRRFRTVVVKAVEPIWMKSVTFRVNYTAFIQLCLHSNSCGSGSGSSEQLECWKQLPILTPENRAEEREIDIRFKNAILIVRMNWKPVTSEDVAEVNPI